MGRSIVKLGLPLLAMLAAGCTSIGTGVGSTPPARTCQLQLEEFGSGVRTMNATLSDGKIYSGQFFQITKDTTVNSVGRSGPAGLQPGAGGAGKLGRGTVDELRHPLHGPCRGQLGAPSGEHMRCKFSSRILRRGWPAAAAANVRCPDGKTIDATFPVLEADARQPPHRLIKI